LVWKNCQGSGILVYKWQRLLWTWWYSMAFEQQCIQCQDGWELITHISTGQGWKEHGIWILLSQR
jgi:hypothetical protein